MRINNKNFKAARVILAALILLTINKKSFAQNNYNVRYFYNTNSIKLSKKIKNILYDSIILNVELGKVYYNINANDSITKVKVCFEQESNLNFNFNEPTTIIYNDTKKNLYIIENTKQYDTVIKYKFPNVKLTKSNDFKLGYTCNRYIWTNSAGIQYSVWIANNLSKNINPGVIKSSIGAIICIEYVKNNEIESLELISFEKSDKDFDSYQPLKINKITNGIIPFLNIQK